MIWVVIAVFAALLFVVFTYNILVGQVEAANNSRRQIDVQLDRRYKVLENLINVVRPAMDFEASTLKDVTALRAQAVQAKSRHDDVGQFAAEDGISAITRGLNVVFEQYPELASLNNVRQLQEEIVSTENRLSYAKQAYNDAVEVYQARKQSFFSQMVVKLFATKLDKPFAYWQLNPEQATAYENHMVKL